MHARSPSDDLVASELAATSLRQHGKLRLRVTGSSMLPTICPQDILLIRRCQLEAAVEGDIVLFTRDRRLFAHRVTARRGAALVTQGDGIGRADAPVDAAEFLGKVMRIVRSSSSKRPRPRLTVAARAAAALFRRSWLAGRVFTQARSLFRGEPA
jgi:signal peptidase I